MKQAITNFLNKKVNLKTTILTDLGARTTEGQLEIRDVPAWYSHVLSNNASVIGRKITNAFKPARKIAFDPTIHTSVEPFDYILHNNIRYIVWGVKTKPYYEVMVAVVVVDKDTKQLSVRHEVIVPLIENSAVVDKDYISARDREELENEKHKHIYENFGKSEI